MLDILIANGLVVDGTGKPSFKADVGIAEGRIEVVADSVEQEEAVRTIRAQGLHLATGFIAPHTHSELTLLADPRAVGIPCIVVNGVIVLDQSQHTGALPGQVL
jgi:N-acyl-D-amino-acid deacylase